MFEKVNPSHPDKVADRIAGAIVDLCYKKDKEPKCACELLIGHGKCYIQIETSVEISKTEISEIVRRLTNNNIEITCDIVPQDAHLSLNQYGSIKCGDNGIFIGCPTTTEQQILIDIVKGIYSSYPYDGKYIIKQSEEGLDESKYDIIMCQSHFRRRDENHLISSLKNTYDIDLVTINPLGEWTGGTNVDSGATNRKLGSDMGDAVTGGGLMGKDLSKMDVTANILCHLKAIEHNCIVKCSCAIGDKTLLFKLSNGEREEISVMSAVQIAHKYIREIGGFEKFAEWGLIR